VDDSVRFKSTCLAKSARHEFRKVRDKLRSRTFVIGIVAMFASIFGASLSNTASASITQPPRPVIVSPNVDSYWQMPTSQQQGELYSQAWHNNSTGFGMCTSTCGAFAVVKYDGKRYVQYQPVLGERVVGGYYTYTTPSGEEINSPNWTGRGRLPLTWKTVIFGKAVTATISFASALVVSANFTPYPYTYCVRNCPPGTMK